MQRAAWAGVMIVSVSAAAAFFWKRVPPAALPALRLPDSLRQSRQIVERFGKEDRLDWRRDIEMNTSPPWWQLPFPAERPRPLAEAPAAPAVWTRPEHAKRSTARQDICTKYGRHKVWHGRSWRCQ